jgi:hypothetical protein
MNHLTFRVIQSCLLSPSSNGNEAPSPAPPPPQFARCASSSGPPPPLSRGRKARAFSFPRRTRVRVLQTKATKLLPPKNKGRRSAEKARLSRGASPRSGCCHPSALRAKAARSAERARLSALHRGSCFGHMPKLNPGRASHDAARRSYLHLGIALKRSTSRAGRNAGGVDARTARERQ